ncbi:hypothetical protein LCGC14_0489890 [marine sediment metagenome]|uniref:Glycosyl hydrolase family 95 N-terminal domain-containing protein n=1 Tax=marine sediment metagenome TaxID=412755 RepID=A0A0F9UTU6_9ZZZZ|nr:hypothetical protein [Phycisphaerae bacterium]HDZ43593.1 hypothetical protein [Phycisphaerae bacterium]
MHRIEIDYPVLVPEDGLLLGNGDLSVSVYMDVDHIVWRFGKNDVWDRRLDTSDCPRPAHIDEIAHGIREEGWVSHGYVFGEGEATKTVKDPRRMKEITEGWPAYAKRSYPCPKPVGELRMRIPNDQTPVTFTQRQTIETGELEIEATWPGNWVIRVVCFVAPDDNVLCVKWDVENWNDDTGSCRPAVWFKVWRWPDPTIESYHARLFARARYNHYFGQVAEGKSTPLDKPITRDVFGRFVVQQNFAPSLDFPGEGFKFMMAPFTDQYEVEALDMLDTGEAMLHVRPTDKEDEGLSGWLALAVPTASDEGGAEAELKRIMETIGDDCDAACEKWRAEQKAAADEFWSRSSISIPDAPEVEDVWYHILHARRCAFRRGVVAPGLALPSTVQDYSLWHGDYHMNFNYQQGFWGDNMANHVELGDSFFPGMNHMVEIGRKLARDYWGCRGTFVQLGGYPFPVHEDTYGTGSLCRMAYMSGWVCNHYWWHYLYTLDADWLREEGYSVIRDCALFYTDFLEKWDDGKYHAFPSIQGEAFFTGKAEDYTDKPQVLRHARYCLQSAIKAAEVLGETEHVDEWRDRLDNLVQIDDFDALGWDDEKIRRYNCSSPEFLCYDVGSIPTEKSDEPAFAAYRGATNMLPWWWMIALHNDVYNPDVSLESLRKRIAKWRQPNGVLRAMDVHSHSYIGCYTEAMGIIAPIMEMMMQSWDGRIRIFPSWPSQIDGEFTTLRAEGAFLVSASRKDGKIQPFTIHSEAGAPCHVVDPWDSGLKITDPDGKDIPTREGLGGSICFDTDPGKTYTLQPA